MGFALSLISIVLCYFSPASLFPTLAPYHIQQIILIPAVAASLASLTMRGARLQTPQFVLIIGLWFAAVMSFLSRLALRTSLEVFIDFAIFVCLYFLISANAFSLGRVRFCCTVVVVCTVIMAAQAIVAYYTDLWHKSLVLESGIVGISISRRARGWGVLNDPNDFAQFLIMGMGLLGIFWRKRNLIGNILLLGPPAAVLTYAIYLTQSRGAIFGLLAIAYVVIAPRIGKAPAAVFAIVIFLMLLALNFGGGREISIHEGSAAGRIEAWGAGLAQLKSRPLFGSGFGQFTEYNDLTAHNSFVLCFAELGLFGYFFWLALIVVDVMGLEKLIRLPIKAPEDARFWQTAMSIRAALYGYLTASWFLSRTYTHSLYILLALAAVLIQMRQPVHPEIVKPARSWVPMTIGVQLASIAAFWVIVRLRSFG